MLKEICSEEMKLLIKAETGKWVNRESDNEKLSAQNTREC